MSHSLVPDVDLATISYIVIHVFFFPRPPHRDDHSIDNDNSLALAVASALHLYRDHIPNAEMAQWGCLSGMLDKLRATLEFEALERSRTVAQLSSLNAGDTCAFVIRAQNAAIIFSKQNDVTLVESFELFPRAEDVMASRGKLICSYPGPAIEIPSVVFDSGEFLSELANFLVHMNEDILDATSTTQKAQSTVTETRDTTSPRYITELLFGILRGVGLPAEVTRISKRIGDDVLGNNSELPWRRSPLWLLIRVSLQVSLERSSLGRHAYKTFILFFMCCIAKESTCADLSNDVLHAMSAKISRRLHKLGDLAPDWLSHTASQTCADLWSILEERWKQVKEAQHVHRSPSQLDLAKDTQLSLVNSGDHLRGALANQNADPPGAHFNPKHRPRGALDDFISSDPDFFQQICPDEPYLALYDFEHAVEQGIDAWVGQVTDHDEACESLEVTASEYSSRALKTYKSNPELLSVMFLTMIELWIALDKIAIKEIPMLKDYSPEIPTALLEDLLLSRRTNFDRLRRAHEYLADRHTSSKSQHSVFSSKITAHSFCIRFYEESLDLQRLKARIEKAAQEEVCQKVAELDRAKSRYEKLQRMAANAEHIYTLDRYGNESDAKNCTKCYYERELRSMKISVHEWPLPSNQLYAKAVVFELDCPISFNMWRSATFHLLVDLCSVRVQKREPYIDLFRHFPFFAYHVCHPRARVTLASDARPFTVTHYKERSINHTLTKEDICVNNGLEFYGYDVRAHTPVEGALGNESIKRYCTYRLQDGPYRNLQTYVDATSHTSNEVMANQADCHKDLSIHEFIAFGHLRSGNMLQWLNVLRELRGRALTFHNPEVHFLVAQAVSQVGPFADGEWTWHQELLQISFCDALFSELEQLLHDIEANWQEGVTIDTISFLLRRVLASNTDSSVAEKALGLLRTTRGKIFGWMQELSKKLTATPGDEVLQGSLRDTAAICRGTFDFDHNIIPEPQYTPEDIRALLSSAMLIQRHTPIMISSLPSYSQLLLDRSRRISLTLEMVVSDVIQADTSGQGINLAVRWVWPGYRPGSSWVPLESPNSRWIACKTAAMDDQMSQVVHLNLLDGLLLVDGKPLGRLPSEIQQHGLYQKYFGKQVLDVVPSDLPGMDYATKGTISCHKVHFSLRGNVLVIKAIDEGSSDVMELIPPERLEGDIPSVLIRGYAHWLNISISIMEIRPITSIWQTSSKNWRIDCTPGRLRMHRDDKLLVDTRSISWEMVSALLKPLDTPLNLIMTVSPIDSTNPSSPSQLSVSLPRYGLSFYIDEDGDLQSRNLRGMVYDENQSIETLFGLVNQLVLRPKHRVDINSAELVPRCVLIPKGKPSFQKDGHHVRIEINTGSDSLRQVTYEIYTANTDLGCLQGNASLSGGLFRAYLHALTSGCGTDPLTGRSGTEEALSILRSARSWSIMKLGHHDEELIGSIASICPERTWYPSRLKRMQMTAWLNLPVMSQHHDLYLVCKGIREHCIQLSQARQGRPLTSSLEYDNHLLERSAQRTAYLFPHDISEQYPKADLDLRYHARDVPAPTSGEHRAYAAATAVYRRAANSRTNKNVVLNLLKSWTGDVLGDVSQSLRYDRSWLAPNLPWIWVKVYSLLRKVDEGKWYQMLFSLPAMAYASPELSDLVYAFVAFASDPQFHKVDPPPYDSYDLSEGYCPSSTTLNSYVSDCAHAFEHSPEYRQEPARSGESSRDLLIRRFRMYSERLSLDTRLIVRQLSDAWPSATPPQCSLDPNLYDIAHFTSEVHNLFTTCYQNHKLREHFTQVQGILNSTHSHVFSPPPLRYSFSPAQRTPPPELPSLTIDHLFIRPAPPLPVPNTQGPSLSGPSLLYQLTSTVELSATNNFQRGYYASSLRASADHFLTTASPLGPRSGQQAATVPTAQTLKAYYSQCNAIYVKALEHLRQYLAPINNSERALERSGLWPRITTHVLFHSLASNRPTVLPDDWKSCLTKFALLALEVQRARRLLRLHLDNLPEEFQRELENKGCGSWAAEAHPDWLLIQLQGNFLIRKVQAEVAIEMMEPRSGSNAVQQLNMGEGKSSVIVPMVSADLADGDQLVRVIVPKALTIQMFHLLVDRLGGLVNRRVYFLPFSRSSGDQEQDQAENDPQKRAALREVTLGKKMAALQELMFECMRKRGILIVQPEHILSLRLVSVEKQLPGEGDTHIARSLLMLQRWLHTHARDILDESDEILHARYQLVYAIGAQRHIEGFPGRWTTTQQVLGLVNKHAASLRELFPFGVEYEQQQSGSFPHLRILHADAGQQLISLVVRDILDGRLPNYSSLHLHSDLRDAVRKFMTCEHVTPEDTRPVQEYAQNTPLWSGLLLLRGLLATGILHFAFSQRRWRVDYGLAPDRTMLAVPYRAKDVPAQRAEFGHPDVAVILTCLSYYYGGLSDKQLKKSFEILFKQDDPTLEYNLWLRDRIDVPERLRKLSGINMKSSNQWNLLSCLFKRNQATVDFYLSNIVFPRQAKEFPSKLSCSGWDLAEKKERLLTGFSGTNDGQYLLPLHITQHDLDHQLSTNAKVLSYLLQPENSYYMCVTNENGERRNTEEFLRVLVAQKPEIRVLLDVGAQMLDLQNHELAESWLKIDTRSSAVIYFKEDELVVTRRDGSTELLLSSPFAQQLSQCVVYLDDAHTRGTDIKFPGGFRAAVTLGPKVTKDRLTQGCMRMRKLGHSHSVMFFAPLEVDLRIRTVAGKQKEDVIETSDILLWAMHETCEEIQQRAPHWAQQGMDHIVRYNAWNKFCTGKLSAEGLSDKWLQPEGKKLEDLYGPRKASSALSVSPEIRERCVALGVLSLRDGSMDEEQERELIHEAEREQQVERPPRELPASHSVHSDVVAFVTTGTIRKNSKAFGPVFKALDATSAKATEVGVWSPLVMATADFHKTVSSSGRNDEYLRPVQWVVSSENTLVTLSPYEVNNLLPRIRSSNRVHLHLYTPRITRSMKTCDDLALYSIPAVSTDWLPPPRLMDQLNVFAGQLYLRDYETYIRLCRFLCVYARDLEGEEGIGVGCDGFIGPKTRPMHLHALDTFRSSPMNSLRTLISLRRKGLQFSSTHMGKLVDGRLLSEVDF